MEIDRGEKGSSLFIYFAALSVNLITFAGGETFTWASPILPKLQSNDTTINPLPRPITKFEESAIASIIMIGALVGPLAGGLISDKLSKKKALLIFGIPMMLAHLIFAFANHVHYFLVARFLIGTGLGGIFSVLPGYVAEISEDRNRGRVGSVLGIVNTNGQLFSYLVGPFVSIKVFSFLNMVPLVLFYALFGVFIPESPYDMVRHKKEKAAEDGLIKLRGRNFANIEKELCVIRRSVEASSSCKGRFEDILKHKGLRKGLLIGNGLIIFNQFSGICAILGYMQIIFQASGSSLSPIYSSIVIGVIGMVANASSSQLIDRAGKKFLLMASCLVSAISLGALGLYFFLKAHEYNVNSIFWLPVTCLIVYMVFFNLGLANIPWVMLGELFPANVKALASAATTFHCFIMSFAITMMFPYMSSTLGEAGSFWIFGGIMIVGFLFSWLVVPETKGRSFDEVQEMLTKT